MSNKSKATEDQFDELHRLVTETLISKIKTGEAAPSDLKNAIDWLKANDFTGVASDGSPLAGLAGLIPELTFDEVQGQI